MLMRVELNGYAPGPGSERAQRRILEIVKPFLEGRILSDPDLAGKKKGMPVSELLGGRVREHIRLYGSAARNQEQEKCVQEALAIADLETVRKCGMPPEDHESYRRLKARDLAPLASGQPEPDQLRSVDYVQMNIAGQGGYPTEMRLLSEIEHGGLKFAFHNRGSAHFGICWPETTAEWLEGMYPFPEGVIEGYPWIPGNEIKA